MSSFVPKAGAPAPTPIETEAVFDWSCRTAASAAVSSSRGRAATPSVPRFRFNIRSMKKLPPTKPWRLNPSRGSPTTEEIGVGWSTTGMWHAWQLWRPLNELCRHSRYGTCSGSEPIASPFGPSAVVNSVWHVAHSSDCWM